MGQKEIPQAGRARLRLQLFNNLDRLPAIARVDLVPVERLIGVNVFVHEPRKSRAKFIDLGSVGEMHKGYPIEMYDAWGRPNGLPC